MDAALRELWEAIEAGDVLLAEARTGMLLALPRMARATRSEAEDFIVSLISNAARHEPMSEAAAFCRLLMSLGSASVKKMASGALRELTSDGAYPPGWVTDIGKPVPGEAWRRHDVFGDDEAIIVTFSYGENRHAVYVLLDMAMLPVATTVVVSQDPDELIEGMCSDDEPFWRWEQLSLAEARRHLEAPLTRAAHGVASDLSNTSLTFLPVARAHLKRLPAQDAPGAAAYTAADRAAAVEDFLRGEQAAQAPDPAVARFWAQALTGYSGRVPGEPPAQVGPRKLAAMLGHVANSFTLTDAQRSGLRPAVTAWTGWAAGHQGLDDDAAAHLMASLPKALDDFDAMYDDPQAAVARAYLRDVAASDTDVTVLAEHVTRRSVAVPFPEMRDNGASPMDVSDPSDRAAMVAADFADCNLDDGMTREDLIAEATRVTEELWAGEPAATWEAARRMILEEGKRRHDVIHALLNQPR